MFQLPLAWAVSSKLPFTSRLSSAQAAIGATSAAASRSIRMRSSVFLFIDARMVVCETETRNPASRGRFGGELVGCDAVHTFTVVKPRTGGGVLPSKSAG